MPLISRGIAPFIIVPLVAAFFIDLVNALMIPFFLVNFWLSMIRFM